MDDENKDLVDWFADRILEEVGDGDGLAHFMDELRLDSPQVCFYLKLCRRRLVVQYVFEKQSPVLIGDIDAFIGEVIELLKHKKGIS